MLTPETLVELKALLAKATPGPWRVSHGSFDHPWNALIGDNLVDVSAHINDVGDAELIAALRNHAEELIAAAEELRAIRADERSRE